MWTLSKVDYLHNVVGLIQPAEALTRTKTDIPWARKMSACRLPFGEGSGNPPQYSCLENPMNRGGWQTTVHGVSRAGHDLVTKPPTRFHLDSNYNSFLNLWPHRLQHHILALLSLHNCMSQFPKISLSLSLSLSIHLCISCLLYSLVLLSILLWRTAIKIVQN